MLELSFHSFSYENYSKSFCRYCEKTFSNEAMKPPRLNEHLTKMHFEKVGNNKICFQDVKWCVKWWFEKWLTVGSLFQKSSGKFDTVLLFLLKFLKIKKHPKLKLMSSVAWFTSEVTKCWSISNKWVEMVNIMFAISLLPLQLFYLF